MSITLQIPELYDEQREIMQSKAKRKVLACGRRAGKTTLACDIATQRALQGQWVVIVSTTQDQADTFWDMLNGRYQWSWLAPLIDQNLIEKNEVRRNLFFKWCGGRIRVKTGKDPDVLRGGRADVIIFDEAARLKPDVWYAVGAPMLADSDGDAFFLSTPDRKNWFYHLFLKAQGDESGLWQAWNFSTEKNIYLKPSPKIAVQRLAEDMTDEMYRQEILAEFISSSGRVFTNIDTVCTAEERDVYNGYFVAGLDWGQTNDWTVLAIFDANLRQMVKIARFRGESYNIIVDKIAQLIKEWNIQTVMAESNAMGKPNIERLQLDGFPIVPFYTSSSSKAPLIEALILSMNRRDVLLLDDPILKHELEIFERSQNEYTGHPRYSAPYQMHDDTVIATALGLRAINERFDVFVMPEELKKLLG